MRDSRSQQEAKADHAEHDPLPKNVRSVLSLHARDAKGDHKLHRFLESIGYSVEKPYFVVFIVLFCAAWVVFNTMGKHFGFMPFDKPPFPWLQGVVSFGSLITATIVLTKQYRAAAREKRQNDLQLQLIMLTEQKVAKLIQLVEELRRDLPMIKDRHDPEAETLKNSPHAQTVLDVIEQHLNKEK
jgi:uncharacterized membrane protein